MKRFLFSPILMATVLLMGSLTLLVIEVHSHDAVVLNVAEHTDGFQKFTTWHQDYSLGGTDSAKFDLSERKTDSSNPRGWQELKFKSTNIPDYENPADANTDNDYEITLSTTTLNSEPHTHIITIRVTNIAETPTAVGTISNVYINTTGATQASVNASSYFSEPDGQTLTYSASSSNTGAATVSVSGSTITVTANGGGSGGNATITVTASDPGGLSATQTFTAYVSNNFTGEADAIPGLSSEEQLLLGGLLSYDTVIFNELHNASEDANDWLELRNVSGADFSLDDWQLTIRTGEAEVVIEFPTGTVIPAGDVLLLTNTGHATAEASVLSIVSETFALPQVDFALILRNPTAFGDIAGNYFEAERPETAPALTVDTVWYRSMPTVSGYRADAWTESTYQDGLGTPGYRPLV